MMKNMKLKSPLTGLLAIAILLPTALRAAASTDEAAIARNLDTFNTLFKELNTYYVDSIDADKSIKVAIDAMLGDLDPYTEYMPASDQDYILRLTTGYGGIGSYIMQAGDSVMISEPYDGSPAARAGLKPGDVIVKINGDTTAGWNSEKVSQHLKGQANTKLSVTVRRPYEGIRQFDIMREKIRETAVPYYGVARDSIGYIPVTAFSENSAEEVRNALQQLIADSRVKAIALDLRSNGGGLLESAVQIVGNFVPKGTLVLQQRGKEKQDEKTYKTTQDPIAADIPLFVFIDGNSASASEITAGSLQDLDRAVIIGTRSFGKGLVQATRQMPYNGLLKITTGKYYIPSGRLIQAIDYSHRNIDGSVNRIPDSLTTVFHTAHGREVRDGGGISPDITVTYPEMTRLYYNIVRDNWAFNFATRYAHKHPAIASPEEFEITDSIYNEFKQFIDPERFKYDKVCEDRLADLEKLAEIEGYMNDSTRAQFKVMARLLKHDLNKDLDTHRSEISQMLAMEILKRYYYQRGPIIHSLKTDECIDQAMKLVAKPEEYYKILNVKR